MNIQEIIHRQTQLNIVHANTILIQCNNYKKRGRLLYLLQEVEELLNTENVSFVELNLSMTIVEELLEAQAKDKDFGFNFEESQD